MNGFIKDTYLEFADRKKIIIFIVATLFVCLIVILSGQVSILSTVENADGLTIEQFSDQFDVIKLNMFNFFLLFLIILTLFSSISIFPKRLMKGTAEYYLARPLSRTSLFIKQVVSVITVYGSVMILSSLVVYSTVIFIHGNFDGFIILLFLNIMSYFIWLSIAIFAAITFGSTAMAFISMFFIWVVQLILSYHESINQLIESKMIRSMVDILYYIFPKTGEFSDLSLNIALGKPVESYLPLYSSIIFALVLLIITSIIFNRKNY